jgi:hypothetical protein
MRRSPCSAVTCTSISAGTGSLRRVNVATVSPAAKATCDGSIRLRSLLDKATTTPPSGAGSLSVILPSAESPATISAGTSRATIAVRTRVIVAERCMRPTVAWICTEPSRELRDVRTVSSAVRLPAATRTSAGTPAASPSELLIATSRPPAGAGCASRTVARAVWPATTRGTPTVNPLARCRRRGSGPLR